MSGTELYRKYRPIQLSDIVGQQVVVRSLSRQARHNAFNHAYLLVGHYGAGKTSVARIIAKLLTCEHRKEGTDKVCGRCESCMSIHNGTASDVQEIDGASTRGIDNVKAMKQDAYYPPISLKRKVYVIDECHKLTSDAFDALLKVLEEPPQHVHFILCTTEPRKLLPTILSRCQRWRFTAIPPKLISERLDRVASKENIKVEDGVCLSIARQSKGSLRDALVDLEMISSYSDGNVTAKDFSEFFGAPDRRAVYQIVRMVADANPAGMLRLINDLILASVDTRVILADVSDVMRQVFMFKYCGRDESMVDLDAGEMEVVSDLANRFSEATLIKIASSFSRVEKQIAVNINERWILEAALLNCIVIVRAEARQKQS